MQFPQRNKADLNSSQQGHYLQVLGKPRAREGQVLPRRIPKQQNTLISNAKASGSPGRTQEECKPLTGVKPGASHLPSTLCFEPKGLTGEQILEQREPRGDSFPSDRTWNRAGCPLRATARSRTRVHANDQQLPGLTAQPTATLGNLSLKVRH